MGAVAALFILSLVGCGGGGSEGALAPESMNSGQLAAEGRGLKPYAASGTSATIFGISGAITRAVYNDVNPTMSETEIVFSDYYGESIKAIAPDGTGERTILTGAGQQISWIRVSLNASWVYFQAYDSGTGTYTIKRVAIGGGTPTTIATGAATGFALTPDAAKIVYRLSGSGNLYYANADGTSPVLIASGVFYQVVHCPDTTHTVLWDISGLLYSVTMAAGQTLSAIAAAEYAAFGTNPTTARIWGWDSGASVWRWEKARITAVNMTGTSNFFAYDAGNFNVMESQVGPDDRTLAIPQASPEAGLYVADFPTPNFSPVWRGGYVGACAWTPYIPTRNLVNTGSVYTAAGAVLTSQVGSVTKAFVLLEATTNSSTSLTRVDTDSGAEIVYQIDCDAIKKMHYSDTNNYALKAIVPSQSTNKAALVSFNGTTGRVQTIITVVRKPEFITTRNGKELVADCIGEIYSAENGMQPMKPTGNVRL